DVEEDEDGEQLQDHSYPPPPAVLRQQEQQTTPCVPPGVPVQPQSSPPPPPRRPLRGIGGERTVLRRRDGNGRKFWHPPEPSPVKSSIRPTVYTPGVGSTG